VNERVERAVALARTVYDANQRLDVGFLAAAVAYYAFVSLIPLALLSFAVASAVGDGVLVAGAADALGGLLAPEGQSLLTTALEGEAGRGGATVAGVAVLLWSGLRLLRGLDRAFSRVYGEATESLPEQLRDAAVVLVATLGGIAGMAVVGALVALLPVLSPLRGAGVVVLWATLVVAFLPLYALFPDAEVSPRAALPGAAVAATAFVALGSLFGAYTAVAGGFAVYGALGAVLLLVTWLYFGSLAVVYGAVLNAVLAGELADDGGPPPPPAGD